MNEWLIVGIIVALIFGGSQLPKLARSLGSAKGEFEKGLKDGEAKSGKADEPKADSTESTES
jgi:sec-independent protein translocase protein TatA